MIRADHKYNGFVSNGSGLIETATGSVGFQVRLSCDDGETYFIIWLTEKNKTRAERYFQILGVTLEKLKDPTYLEYGLPQEIEGREVSFGTKEEEYQGKRSVKVAWIGKKSEGNLPVSAARFFGGGDGGDKTEKAIIATDEDVPF